jgi:hypothetical protein
LLFRSEERAQAWRQDHGQVGETLTLAQTWDLSRLWYGDRLNPDFRGRTVEAAQDIFRRLGLQSSFWYLDTLLGDEAR